MALGREASLPAIVPSIERKKQGGKSIVSGLRCDVPVPSINPPKLCKTSLAENSKLPLSVCDVGSHTHTHDLSFSLPRRPANLSSHPSHAFAWPFHPIYHLAPPNSLSLSLSLLRRITRRHHPEQHFLDGQLACASAQSWSQQHGAAPLTILGHLGVSPGWFPSPHLIYIRCQPATKPKPASQPASLKRHPTPKRTSPGAGCDAILGINPSIGSSIQTRRHSLYLLTNLVRGD
ncbi:hypothetical protein LX32DRAFT_425636 [Colletotrichum zoysiae]|uniref:Uncharacterized protein n=1 Tax=Colletotrichum zoysiae TaxID=1216348 RepID=A0AAD9M0T9_9PEZI|nr:hypothetical protein LX32DRAFT_425636 [Colletotrichum zoysiae]